MILGTTPGTTRRRVVAAALTAAALAAPAPVFSTPVAAATVPAVTALKAGTVILLQHCADGESGCVSVNDEWLRWVR